MMRLTTPFPDFNNIINDVPSHIIYNLVEKVVNHLIKNHEIIFNSKNMQKNFRWFQLCCLGIILIASNDLEVKFREIHVNPLARIMNNNYNRTLKDGFRLLYKIEPKLAYEIYETLEAYVIGAQVGEITGVYSFNELNEMSRRFTGVTCEWMCC